MDYNTQREKLALPEYGRNIQKMVNYAKTIKDKEERNKLVKSIITVMGNMNPHLRDVTDFKHKLWDHLAIMSDFSLDIDSPYDIPSPKSLLKKPDKVPYGQSDIKYKHYGKTIVLLINKAIDFEEGKEKDKLIEIIANHLKKSYLLWNRESVSDNQILEDLKELSNGKLTINKNIKLIDTKEIFSVYRKAKRVVIRRDSRH